VPQPSRQAFRAVAHGQLLLPLSGGFGARHPLAGAHLHRQGGAHHRYVPASVRTRSTGRVGLAAYVELLPTPPVPPCAGDFDTEEEAARAYDLESIRRGKLKALNFIYRSVNDDAMEEVNSTFAAAATDAGSAAPPVIEGSGAEGGGGGSSGRGAGKANRGRGGGSAARGSAARGGRRGRSAGAPVGFGGHGDVHPDAVTGMGASSMHAAMAAAYMPSPAVMQAATAAAMAAAAASGASLHGSTMPFAPAVMAKAAAAASSEWPLPHFFSSADLQLFRTPLPPTLHPQASSLARGIKAAGRTGMTTFASFAGRAVT